MKRVFDMQKLERKHYLKHYQGGFAMVLDGGQAVTGEIEEVDMEDGSVLIKAGERSQWVDGEKVTPSLKQWKDIHEVDLECIFNNIDWSNLLPFTLDFQDYEIVRQPKVIQLRSKFAKHSIYIDQTWIIYACMPGLPDTLVFPKNTGTIMFLLCELGYDVTGQFHRK